MVPSSHPLEPSSVWCFLASSSLLSCSCGNYQFSSISCLLLYLALACFHIFLALAACFLQLASSLWLSSFFLLPLLFFFHILPPACFLLRCLLLLVLAACFLLSFHSLAPLLSHCFPIASSSSLSSSCFLTSCFLFLALAPAFFLPIPYLAPCCLWCLLAPCCWQFLLWRAPPAAGWVGGLFHHWGSLIHCGVGIEELPSVWYFQVAVPYNFLIPKHAEPQRCESQPKNMASGGAQS